MAFSREFPIDVSRGGSTVRECIVNNDKEIKKIYEILSREVGLAGSASGTRQCVLSGKVDSKGALDCFTESTQEGEDGTHLNFTVGIAADEIPVILDFSDGFSDKGARDIIVKLDERDLHAWELPDDYKEHYLFIRYSPASKAISFGYTDIIETYAFVAPQEPAKNQFWYDMGSAVMKRYDGSTWQKDYVIFVAIAKKNKPDDGKNKEFLTLYRYPVGASAKDGGQMIDLGDTLEFKKGKTPVGIKAPRFIGPADMAYNIPTEPGHGNIWISTYY